MATPMKTRAKTIPLQPEERDRLQRVVDADGLDPIAAHIGISPNTLARLLARQGAYESCKKLARIFLREKEAA